MDLTRFTRDNLAGLVAEQAAAAKSKTPQLDRVLDDRIPSVLYLNALHERGPNAAQVVQERFKQRR